MKYFLLGAFSSAFFLYGVAFAYGASGTTSLSALGLAAVTGNDALALIAVGLLLVGFGFKVARGAVPHVDAGRLPGRPDLRDRVHVGRHEGGRVRGARPRLMEGFPGLRADWRPVDRGPGGDHDGGREHPGHRADRT